MTISTWRSCITATAATALAVGAFMGGCGSTATSSQSSDVGESCASEFDCKSGLECIGNVCVTAGTTPGNDGGPTEDAPSQTDGPSSADVKTDTKPTGEGGKDVTTVDVAPGDEAPVPEGGGSDVTVGSDAPPPPPPGSLLGQACTSTPDCSTGLVCIPIRGGTGAGICDLATFGITPTGESCTGECNVAADCAELPSNIGTTLAAQLAAPATVHTCDDVLALLPGGFAGSCPGTLVAGDTSAIGTACFLYKTYCQGATSALLWTCEPSTNALANHCEYTGPCTLNGGPNTFLGCPTETRGDVSPTVGTAAGAPYSTTCNVVGAATTGTCTAVVVDGGFTGCNTAQDCNGVDGGAASMATADGEGQCNGQCVCSTTHGCYNRCMNNLDCPVDYTCATATSLCTLAAGCTVNSDCTGKVDAGAAVACVSGLCQASCSNDHDCSPSSGAPQVIAALGDFSGSVCNLTTKTCETAGCSSTSASSCAGTPLPGTPALATPVNSFCVKPFVPTAAAQIKSAITGI